jgi:indole-3-glycerol phosphate synthase
MILDKIVKAKKEQLKEEMSTVTINEMKNDIKNLKYKANSLYEKLNKKDKISVIAEIKKASPSKGIIKEDFNYLQIAKEYYNSDVDAVSVLTEKKFFLGYDKYLKEIRNKYPLTILRKDFIINEWQIYQSRIIGADAILLIVAILTDDELKRFYSLAKELSLDSIVEVHNEDELKRALKIDVNIIGINNRNLKNFDVSLNTTKKLIAKIPKNKVVISESGIKNKEDIKMLKNLGVDAVLIGESFMRAKSIQESIKSIKSEC